MAEVGIRALKQNASAVVARAAAGEVVVITDRGRPVAQMLPIADGGLEALRRAGLVREPRHSMDSVPGPLGVGASLSQIIERDRADER